MKNIVSILLVINIFCYSAFADCNFATGITPGPNNTFIYSQECHRKVGQLVDQNKSKDAQIADYVKAISLKDLAYTAADQRATLWNDTAAKLEDRLQKVDSLQSKNETLYFGLGVLTTFAAAWAAGKLMR